jgi:hypothetical protein
MKFVSINMLGGGGGSFKIQGVPNSSGGFIAIDKKKEVP